MSADTVRATVVPFGGEFVHWTTARFVRERSAKALRASALARNVRPRVLCVCLRAALFDS